MLAIGNAIGIPFTIMTEEDIAVTADSTIVTADNTILTADDDGTI